MELVNPAIPILVTGYNRPELLERTLDRLQNLCATNVWVAIDGPKIGKLQDEIKVYQCQSLIEKYQSMIGNRTKLNSSNLGCKYGMSEAITWFFGNVSSGIVIEDDLVFGPNFINFVTAALDCYQHDANIGSVTGYMPLNLLLHPEYKKSNLVSHPFFSAWGWG